MSVLHLLSPPDVSGPVGPSKGGGDVETYPIWPNLPAMMLDRAGSWPNRPMLRHFRDGVWHRTTWDQFARTVASVAAGLRNAGIRPGDRVMIVSENRPEYPMAETALMAIRAIPVPAYITNTAADHAHIIRDSGAHTAIASTPALAARLHDAGGLDRIITLEPAEDFLSWSILATTPADPASLAAEVAAITPDALACIIYTSGTGGTPKGVMLPHRCILSNCQGAFELLLPLHLKDETYLSYLPSAHSYEHTVGLFFLPSIGCEIVYARGVEHLSADMLHIRPTILTVVPRILEVIQARILAQIHREKPWKQALFNRALQSGLRRVTDRRLNPLDRLLDPLCDRLVRAKVRDRFGGRLVGIMSGGARLEPETGRFFLSLGLLIMQGYGQTEAGPVISANPPDAIRIETVGKPLKGVAVRIAQDGEILVRGDLVMQGYWSRPEDTAATIQDGWLHTGDIGALDPDGYLRITDRKKDMIVLSGGENVSPARIEGMLVAEPEIAQAVVCGDGSPALRCLLVPAEGCSEPAVARALARVNARLSVTERVRWHAAVPPFSIENGLLTPSHKVRRREVMKVYATLLEGLGT